MTKPKSATADRWDSTITNALPNLNPIGHTLIKSLMQTAYLIGKAEGIAVAIDVVGPHSQTQNKDSQP